MSEISQGMSVTNTCYECMVIERDRLAGFQGGSMCQACVEAKEGRDDTIAYNLVDDGNDIYRYAPMYTSLTKLTPEPSGHDWTSSESAIGIQRWQARMTEEWDDNCKLVKMAVEFVDKDDPWIIRKEFTPPIAQLMDGGTHEELWELDDYTQRQRETECRWCHLLTPKVFNDCQACDKPLENNLI